MHTLYDRITTFRGGSGQSSRSPYPNPSTKWNGETSARSSDESSGSKILTKSQMTEHVHSSRTGRTRESSRCHSRNYHSTPFNKIPSPPLRDELREHISGFHPFTAEVMMAWLPSKWQWPHMDTYDGTTYPSTHVKSYITQANIFSLDGRVHCRLFPTTLWGPALDWYYSLPANSVNSFEMLCVRFTARFADSKPASTSSASLQNVVKGDNESLWHYMARFTRATLSIPDLHPAVAWHSLLVGLKPGPFLESLYVDPPPNMDSLRTRTTRYISIEEITEARKRRPQSTIEGQRSQKRGQAETLRSIYPSEYHTRSSTTRSMFPGPYPPSSAGTVSAWGWPRTPMQLPSEHWTQHQRVHKGQGPHWGAYPIWCLSPLRSEGAPVPRRATRLREPCWKRRWMRSRQGLRALLSQRGKSKTTKSWRQIGMPGPEYGDRVYQHGGDPIWIRREPLPLSKHTEEIKRWASHSIRYSRDDCGRLCGRGFV